MNERLCSKHPFFKRSSAPEASTTNSTFKEDDAVGVQEQSKSADTAAGFSSDEPGPSNPVEGNIPKLNIHGKRSATEMSPVHGQDKRMRFNEYMKVMGTTLGKGKGRAPEFEHLPPYQVMHMRQEQEQIVQANTSSALSDVHHSEVPIELGKEAKALGPDKENMTPTFGTEEVVASNLFDEVPLPEADGKSGWSWN